ncbi:MAG: hypothetical protein J5493_01520 [Lachnospiraceae bacterium]|nr:hypothetical protein [Lachnospiraceae bacterium]MBQ6242280.1 hypothetical protein [Lachnospiraceae bacterium]
MKNTVTCPKCGSRKIILIEGSTAVNNRFFPLSFSTYVPLDRYICSECGYTEEWIPARDLPEVRYFAKQHDKFITGGDN